MHIRKQAVRVLIGGAAAAAALVMAANQAFAATWTVTSGGNWSANLTAGTTETFSITTDTAGVVTFTCTASTASGTLPNGTGLPGNDIGTITAATFSGTAANGNKCHGGPGNAASGTGVLTTGTVWGINASNYNATTGVTTGTIGDDGDGSPNNQIDATFTFTSFAGTCNAEATGSANITYTNGTGTLAVANAALTISSATGGAACIGIDPGDTATFTTGTGGYNVLNSSSTHPKITSP